jgi:hypothetical protein
MLLRVIIRRLRATMAVRPGSVAGMAVAVATGAVARRAGRADEPGRLINPASLSQHQPPTRSFSHERLGRRLLIDQSDR